MGPAAANHKPWLIPKKSKLFLEQSIRERENAIPMHVLFQQDLNRLRLMAARTLLDVHVKSDNSVGTGSMEHVRLSAEVEGLGPVFRMTLIIENKSPDKAVIDLSILFHVHTMYYKVSQPFIKVPLLSPGSKLEFPTKVEEVFEDSINPDAIFRPVTGGGTERSLIKVLLLKEGKQTPVLAATVQMPPTDPMMLPFEKIEAVTVQYLLRPRSLSTPRSHKPANMSLEENFKTVADKVRNWKTKPSDDENLALYSLYKQAVFGDVNISEPSGIVEKAKFKAWTKRKGMSQDDARTQYIEMAEKLQSKYA
ncbi:hypothetical protein K1T71_003698 [Dendrolimus kikuchii]|uniref:Uncharacterized protein n=1 Tax=Dendrolimus kikuchii TaxID=765133 RepID=A0ACC1D950_9NEOP|nr:hypothetical protein K1T71_003698 [Dendrolimus kikuchii]